MASYCHRVFEFPCHRFPVPTPLQRHMTTYGPISDKWHYDARRVLWHGRINTGVLCTLYPVAYPHIQGLGRHISALGTGIHMQPGKRPLVPHEGPRIPLSNLLIFSEEHRPMAYPHRVARVTLSGTMFGGQEIWSTGFFMGFEGQDAPAITDTGVSDISNAWQTFFSNASSEISNKYQYTMCKVQMLGVDGKALPDTAKYYSPVSAVNGGSASQALPPQIALVATLANSLPRGLATKGRMFLPGVNALVDSTGHIGTGTTTAIATNLQTFFGAIMNDADTPGRAVLASLGNSLQLRPGEIRNVTQIRVGNVYDTQRRRRNALMEAYQIKPVPIA